MVFDRVASVIVNQVEFIIIVPLQNWPTNMPLFRCNLCLRRLMLFADPSPENPKSFLSECLRHIFCEQCARKLHPICVCKRRVRFMEIRKQMQLKYRMMFQDPQAILKRLQSINNFRMEQHQLNFQRTGQKFMKLRQQEAALSKETMKQDQMAQQLEKTTTKLKYIIQKATVQR